MFTMPSKTFRKRKLRMNVVSFEKIKDKIIELRGEKVILDSDVAELYGVGTRDVNKAVKNNPDKFPEEYIFELTKEELEDLRWKFSTTKFAMTRVLPKAFTERGLYMLATILKSEKASETIIELNFAVLKFKHTMKKKQNKNKGNAN